MLIEKKIHGMVDDALLGLKEAALFSSSEEGLTPIETLLRGAFLALQIHSAHWLDVKYWATIPGEMTFGKVEKFPAYNFEEWKIHIFPQVVVGKYTVDFLSFASCKGCDGAESKRQYLAIECDGHEFHEKTKKQAAHDKARDRFLTGLHIPVMRFTGSEIWREPLGCAQEVISYYEEVVVPTRRVA